jgi:squalene cyclase
MKDLSNKIIISTTALTDFLREAVDKGIEVRRSALCCLSLLTAGLSVKNNVLYDQIINYFINNQKRDGGWTDVTDTLLIVKLLSIIGNDYSLQIEKGKNWMLSQRNPDGGWGRTNRDISLILVTGLLLHLLPQLSDQKAVNWLKNEWKNDFQGTTRLTYKGAFFLLGLRASGITMDNCSLIKETYSFLKDEQNDDGGFGPWKDHPIGSDPWSTGIVLLGLLSYPELIKKEVIENAVNWLAENQLPNGLWPYHYIEEGSAYAYWGLVEALKYLSKEST